MPDSDMCQKLPVSIICPVRNSIADLPAHVEHLGGLSNVVSEIIVVDSQSSDGTSEYLRESLAGHNVLFLDHPPGLYQSWNHAISKATQEYLTVATVGDVLPIESLRRIYQTICDYNADVVVSPPSFLNADISKRPCYWPIHDLIEAAGIRDAAHIPGLVWMIYSIIYMPASLLSSSAGNLYRTNFLKEHPFPHEYGHPGDSVWALQMSLKTRWIIDPKATSYYKIHEKASHSVSTTQEAFKKLQLDSKLALEHAQEDLLGIGLNQSLLRDAFECVNSYGASALLRKKYAEQRSRLIPSFLNFGARRCKTLIRKLDADRKSRKMRLNEWTRTGGWSCHESY
jgi:glycosyltransferase involved in cell wall biosynthesis